MYTIRRGQSAYGIFAPVEIAKEKRNRDSKNATVETRDES